MRTPQTQASRLLILFPYLAFHDPNVILTPLARSKNTTIQVLDESSSNARGEVKIALKSHLVEPENVKVWRIARVMLFPVDAKALKS